MKPIMLLINDLHISKDNILEYEKNWDEALNICKCEGINRIIIGGDIFTTRGVQQLLPMKMVAKCFEKAKQNNIEIFAAFGNHDCPVYGKTDNWLDLYSDQVIVIKDWEYFKMHGCTLAVCPYFPEEVMMPNKLKELDDFAEEHGIMSSQLILYLHAGVHGALGELDVPNEIPIELLTKYGKVLCAHYHNRTTIKGAKIEYIGSSRAHTFGEDEEKGYTLLYDDGTTKFIKNQVNTRYATDNVDLSDLADWKSKYDERYKVRIRVHCTSSDVDTINRDELFERGAHKIEFVTEKIQAIKTEQSDIEEKFDNKGLQTEYKSFCQEKNIDSRFGIDYLTKAK